MQAAACKQASIASERDDARSACGWWIGRCRGQHQRMLSDSSEFVIVDFSAGVLQVSMMVVTVGYAVFGVDTLYGLGMNSNLTEEYKHLHVASFFAAASLAAAALVLLSVRGPHTPVIARYYQVLGPALMGTLFTLNLVQRSSYELRFALSPQAVECQRDAGQEQAVSRDNPGRQPDTRHQYIGRRRPAADAQPIGAPAQQEEKERSNTVGEGGI